MKSQILISLIICGLWALAPNAIASTLDPLYDESPLSFAVHTHDAFSGITAGGYSFSQNRIVSDGAIRIHKFSIADHFFYVSDRGVIEAEDDLSAISIYLTLLG